MLIEGDKQKWDNLTFIYTKAKHSCLGLWLALDDATVENECCVQPYLHMKKVRRIFHWNLEHFSDEVIMEQNNDAKGDMTQCLMMFVNEKEVNSTISWDGGIVKMMILPMIILLVTGKKKEGGRCQYDILFDAGFILNERQEILLFFQVNIYAKGYVDGYQCGVCSISCFPECGCYIEC